MSEDLDSALIRKCKALYSAMEAASKTTPEGLIWSGALTSLLRTIANAGSSDYGKVVGSLTDMGCITQIRKGGGTSSSIWRLNYEPSMTLAIKISPRRNNPVARKTDIIAQQITALAERVTKLEGDLRKITVYLAEKQKQEIKAAEEAEASRLTQALRDTKL